MLGEELIDLVEQAARWRLLSVQVRDKRAVDALAATLAGVEGKIACLKSGAMTVYRYYLYRNGEIVSEHR